MKRKYKVLISVLLCFVIAVFSLFLIYRTPNGRLQIYNFADWVLTRFQTERRLTGFNDSDYKIEFANALSPIDLESYVGNNQIVHPKVLYFGEKFGGHYYWMAYTPYPWYINTYENPCIAYSDDGYNWENITGNPIDDPKGEGYNSDTHLVFNENIGVLECWYRYVSSYNSPLVREVLCRRTSTDGMNWSEEEVILENNSGDYAHYLSPAIISIDGIYNMWVVSDKGGYHVDYYESDEQLNFKLVREIWLDYKYDVEDTKYRPWHLDLIVDNNQFVMVIMCKEIKGSGPRRWDLFLSLSDDNISYSEPKLIIHGSKDGWDQYIYRSSIVKTNDGYRIYYSGLNSMGKHGIGLSESLTLDDFIGAH